MHNAMKAYPVLAEADRKHAEQVADNVAKFLKHFGSKWSTRKLRRLGLYIYYIDAGTWTYQDHARPSSKEARDWEVNLLNFMVRQCFE
jgi:hypothetical protein